MINLTALLAARLSGRFAASAILFFLASKSLHGSDDPTTRATLRGIRGIVVVVESLGAEAIRDGLTVDNIQTDAELSLRKAGVRVIESPNAPHLSYLYINANVYKGKGPIEDLYTFNCSVSFEQLVTVKSNDVAAIVPTWSVDGVGYAGRLNMSKSIRDTLRDLVEKFLNAYLSVNPK